MDGGRSRDVGVATEVSRRPRGGSRRGMEGLADAARGIRDPSGGPCRGRDGDPRGIRWRLRTLQGRQCRVSVAFVRISSGGISSPVRSRDVRFALVLATGLGGDQRFALLLATALRLAARYSLGRGRNRRPISSSIASNGTTRAVASSSKVPTSTQCSPCSSSASSVRASGSTSQ